MANTEVKEIVKNGTSFGIDTRVLWVLAIVYCAQAYVFPLSGGNVFDLYVAQFFFVVFFIVLYILGMISIGKVSKQNLISIICVSIYLLTTIIVNQNSYTINQEIFTTIKLLGFLTTWTIFAWFSCNADIARFLRYIAICLLPLLIYVVIISYNRSIESRAAPFGLQPNWWGELTVAFAIAISGYRKLIYRIFFYALAAIVIFIVQSRSAWLALGFIGLIEFGRLSESKPTGMRLKLLSIIICAVALGFIVAPIRLFIVNKILFLNNPYRGLGTGLTGRTSGWMDAISAGLRSPIFGSGFSTYLFVHNGYLQVFAEGGIFFFSAVCLWIIYKISCLLHRSAWLQLTAVAAPAAFIFVEPRMFNLNMDSMMFWLGMLHWNANNNTFKDSSAGSTRDRTH